MIGPFHIEGGQFVGHEVELYELDLFEGAEVVLVGEDTAYRVSNALRSGEWPRRQDALSSLQVGRRVFRVEGRRLVGHEFDLCTVSDGDVYLVPQDAIRELREVEEHGPRTVLPRALDRVRSFLGADL